LSFLKNKYTVATYVAVLFHLIGLIGILFFDKSFFIAATPVNLLLMLGLILYTQEKINLPFIGFFILCFIVGFGSELLGVNYSVLFGSYAYGKVLGPSYRDVPFMIGINWFIIMYCCGISVNMLLEKASAKLAEMTGAPSKALKAFSIMSDGAMLAVLFDWVMEPAAVKLGYWQWFGDGSIPVFNYLTWFIISTGIMLIFAFLKFNKRNIFAVNLLMIMMMFFMIIRTFL
jgi:putative membrane protein